MGVCAAGELICLQLLYFYSDPNYPWLSISKYRRDLPLTGETAELVLGEYHHVISLYVEDAAAS